ncbi:VOC family protein [Candidatus Saccharibacteria bacterium]|nr:VOC family protein [Candidatus Saccharibacteria bacterium]
MSVAGPDFISLQVTDLEASAAFYKKYLGLTQSQAGPPHAVVFESETITFALREVIPGTELGSDSKPGLGIALWFLAPNAQEIHDKLVEAGVTITATPIDGPFGRTFAFADPDGYNVTLHSKSA